VKVTEGEGEISEGESEISEGENEMNLKKYTEQKSTIVIPKIINSTIIIGSSIDHNPPADHSLP